MNIPVQLNGKLIKGFYEDHHGLEKLQGMYIERIVVVPYKLVNIVAIPMKLETVPSPPEIPLGEPMEEIPL